MNTMHTFVRTSPRRRGVAMFLVLMALGVGVVLAGVVLSTRESGPRIGANAESAAQAEWSSRAAAAYAESVLRASEAWIPKADSGVLMDDFPFAGGTVDVTVTDKDGNPPTESTRELILTATATINGIAISETRHITRVRPVAVENIIDPYLDEFAIYGKNGVRIDSGAQVIISPIGKESVTLEPLKIGTGFSASSALEVDGAADLRNAALYVDGTGSGTLKSCGDLSTYAAGYALPIAIPAVEELLPAEFASLPVVGLFALSANVSGSTTTLTPGRHVGIRVQNHATVLLGGADTAATYRYRIDNTQIGINGILKIQGRVLVHAPTNLSFASYSNLELVDASSSVVFYIGGTMWFDNAGVGVPRAFALNAARNPNDLTSVPTADRIRIIALSTASGGAAAPSYWMDNNAIVVASIHAPQAYFEARNTSTLIGRLTMSTLRLCSGTRLWYDPTLDDRVGYTAVNGPLYNDDGTAITELTTALASVSHSTGAAAVATSLTSAIKTSTNVVACKTDDDGLLEAVVEDVGGLIGGLLGEGKETPTEPAAVVEVSVKAKSRIKSRRLATGAEEMETP